MYKAKLVTGDFQEKLTDHNSIVVSSFMEHCKNNGVEISDSLFESYFKA